MLRCMSNLLQTMSGPEVVVRYAHMELADPDIARARLLPVTLPAGADRLSREGSR